MVELLVSMAVIGLLVALLLPAVQSAREAARMMECRNHLKQMALAVQNYESTHRAIPHADASEGSWMVVILPYLDQAALYEEILADNGSQNAVFSHRPAVVTCPSDPWPSQQSAAPSYGGNSGWSPSGFRTATGPSPYRENNGVLIQPGDNRYLQFRDITDGLSQTAIISEILGADGTLTEGRLRYTAAAPFPYVQSIEVAAECCQRATLPPRTPAPSPWSLLALKGVRWFQAGDDNCNYVHVMPPNGRSCNSYLTAGSMHAGGVHLALVDGSVQFISNSIDIEIWRALGTRNGDEVVTF